MAVNPLDLQTNFMQINSVSKKEALSKEQEVLKQGYMTDVIKKEGDKNVVNVTKTKNTEQLERTDNKHHKNQSMNEGEEKENEKEKEKNEQGDEVNLPAKAEGVGVKIDTVG